MTKFVRKGHQRHRAQARLHIFFGLVLGQSLEDFLKLRLENLIRVGNRNLEAFDPKIPGKRERIINAPA